MPIEATFYIKPCGYKTTVEITDIYPRDEEWFKENNVKISMEEVGNIFHNDFVLYAELDVEGDEDEHIPKAAIFTGGLSDIDSLAALRIEAEKLLKEYKKTL